MAKSKTRVLEKVTNDYLKSLVITSLADIYHIEDELLSRVHEAFREHNDVCQKDEKWPLPDSLLPGQIAAILDKVFSIRNICLAKGADRDTDLLGVYVNDDVISLLGHGAGYEKAYYGLYSTWDKTIWKLSHIFKYTISSYEVSEVISCLKIIAPRVERSLDSKYIAVGNGIFNYKTKQLEDFSEDKVFLSKSPVSYNPNAVNVTIHNPHDGTDWDVESWMNSLSDDPEVVKLLWEILGAVIRPLNRWNKSAWFVSDKGNNGKGTLCELMRNLCGNCHTSITLENFSKNFALEPLLRSSAIIVDENDVGCFVEKAGNMKAVITNDVIQINRKFKTPVTYQWYGFMVQCLNDYPKIKDKSESFFRRQLFIPFTKCFTGAEREYIKKDYINRPEVLEYVLKKVLESDYYKLSEPASCTMALQEYKEINDPIRLFWSEHCEEFTWQFLPFKFLYEIYKVWIKKYFPNSILVGSTTFKHDLLNVVREDEVWFYEGEKKTYHPKDELFGAPEPLVLKYNIEDWKNKNGKTDDEICTPDCTKLASSLRGLVRMTCSTT